MTAKDILLKTLFETPGREHVNIKFFRGPADSISEDALCAQANAAIFQAQNEMVVGTFAMDEAFVQVDVSHIRG